MELTVGAILEGKVKSITSFGAFVSLPDNSTGMVHISEVANAYVSDIRQYLTEGQDVKVMVIGLDNGKINLSIKRLEPRPQREGREGREGHAPRNGQFRSNSGGNHFHNNSNSGNYHHDDRNRGGNHRPGRSESTPPAAPKSPDQLFEERLKQFMSESDSKISSIRQYSDHRTRNSRRR